ncbi:MAG: LysM peptidoglycan-binding domain-containing protein [Patescibacteria group bacterium]|jgi:LysM repeat protein|nr:LysM peptidoglycan-binding domain-containing protein [Patescibacteria group bacterium]
MEEKEKKSKEVTNLSNEFQKEIKERKKTSNWLAISSVAIISLIVLGSLAIGAYEIFLKPEKIVNKNNTEKIESRPTEDKGKVDDKKVQTTAPAATAPSTPTPTAVGTEEYTIVDGDNLGSIATKYGTTVEKLKSANNIQDETLLQIGQKIKIVK